MSGVIRSRLPAVDGLRAVAVLGVVWAHMWSFGFGAPRAEVPMPGGRTVDVNKLLSFWGTGVDLFFVISGFCMHLVLTTERDGRNGNDAAVYGRFLGRRWLRIAPAYYVAVGVSTALAVHEVTMRDVIAHLLFVQGVVPDTGHISPPFWSLAVEWHYYLILPLFLMLERRIGFVPVVAAAAALSLGFRAWVALLPPSERGPFDLLLPARLIEFLGGMWVARAHLAARPPPIAFRSWWGPFGALTVAFAGRVLMQKEFLEAGGWTGHASATLGLPLLSCGYAGLLWNVLSDRGWATQLLSNRVALLFGRLSYSIYLWHWNIALGVSVAAASGFGRTSWVLYLSFLLVCALLLPVAGLSYALLERPYFRFRRRTRSEPIRPERVV